MEQLAGPVTLPSTYLRVTVQHFEVRSPSESAGARQSQWCPDGGSWQLATT